MSAALNTEITLRGTQEELLSMLKVFQKFETENRNLYAEKRKNENLMQDHQWNCAYIDFVRIKGKGGETTLNGLSDESLGKILAEADGEIKVNAGGPWGRFYDLVESELFQELAVAAPGAAFSGTISGFMTGEDITLEAELKDGKLSLEQKRLADDAGDEVLMQLLPYKTFCKLFKIDDEEPDEENYEYGYWLTDVVDSGIFPDMDYESFLEDYPDAKIDEQGYAKAIEKVKELDLQDYREGAAMIEKYVYDPLTKEYTEKWTNYEVFECESCEGKTFVITGNLIYFENRDELTEFIEDGGGKVTGSVSSKTDYLISNDPDATSSKMKKAKELGIPVITEEEFIIRFYEDPEAFGIGAEE